MKFDWRSNLLCFVILGFFAHQETLHATEAGFEMVALGSPAMTYKYPRLSLVNKVESCITPFFQLPFGSKIKPSQVEGYCQTKFPRGKNSEAPLITRPMHDLSPAEVQADSCFRTAGLSPLHQLLKEIPDTPGIHKFLIPCGQSGSSFFGYKNHFTLLELTTEGRTPTAATLYDPKGWLSGWLYGGAARLAPQLPCPVKPVFLGQQGPLNSNDCGRFVLRYIQLRLQDRSLTDVSATAILRGFAALGV